MNDRRSWTMTIGGGLLAAAGLAYANWHQLGEVERAREDVARIEAEIERARTTIQETPTLERDVIVLRELSQVMRGILPDTDDVNNLVRTLQRLSEQSGVRISGLKKKAVDARKSRDDFDKVAYTLSLEGDAFQFLDFLDLIESHERFMRVPGFRLTAARRSQLEQDGVPAHKVTIDVETFVYETHQGVKAAHVEGYERKLDLQLGEINRRKQSLAVQTYDYRGSRSRRDPWIDPRVPAMPDNPSSLSVREQMDLVQGLVESTTATLAKWQTLKSAETVIVEMTTRAELEEDLARLEEELRRVLAEKSVVYVPSERRLQLEVVEPLAALRARLSQTEAGRGPNEAQLAEVEAAMVRHQAAGEHKLMLEAFGAVEGRLETAEADPRRRPLVQRLRDLAGEAHTVIDFGKLKLDVGAIVLVEGGWPIAMINGRSVAEGDLLQDDVIVRAIRRSEIEFIYRGVVFARRL